MFKMVIPAALAIMVGFTPMPTSAAPADLDLSAGEIIQVYGGCGIFRHRGPYGGCRPGGQAGGYIPGRACPWGWHIGWGGRHCWRN